MQIVDAIIATFSPERAVKRAAWRKVLANYEGGKSTRKRKKSRDNSSGDRLVVRDAATVRATMRDMERNHDLVRGALLALTRNIVGPTGISIEPQPRKNTRGETYDSIDDDFARELLDLWRDFCVAPEVTRTLDWVQAQELACRSWLRDGEVFAQLVEGSVPGLKHGSRVPFSIELLEADVVPLDYDQDSPRTVQAGIERSEWGQPTAYYVYKRHPGNGGWFAEGDLKRVPAERMLHVAVRERLSGLRGISQLASTIDRLLDVKDYESSEQLAARVTARIAASIKRDVNMQWTPPVGADGLPENPADREFLLDPAAVLDNLYPGESLDIQNPTRPNPNLGKFRMDMVRAASRAAQLSYSSFAGDYDGTYSAQRQELVESYDGYRMLTAQFVARFVRPIWERFVGMAIASGTLKVPSNIRPETIAQAEFRGPKMPWIDPQKEAAGMLLLSRGGWQSLQQGIADRGGRLQDVFEQLARERALADELGLVLDSDARYVSRSGVTQARQGETKFPNPAENNDAAEESARHRSARTRSENGVNQV